MELETLYNKKPVNAFHATKPEGKINYRYINTTDWKIYDIDADGNETADTEFALGSQCNVIGDRGDSSATAKYLNWPALAEMLTPYFPDGYTLRLKHVIKWVDKIVVTIDDDSDGSAFVIFPSGNTVRMPIEVVVTCMTVDSDNNLWMGTKDAGVYKWVYDDTIGAKETFTLETGHLPSNIITAIVAAGVKVWIITADAAVFFISCFDGHQFEDKTEDFETNTGVDVSNLTALDFHSLVADGGNPYWSMLDGTELSAGENMFYYDAADELFKIKTLPSRLITNKMDAFVKIGDYVYCLDHTTNYATIWKFSTAVILQTGTAALTGVRTNGEKIYFFALADLCSCEALIIPSTITQENTKISEMTDYLGTLGASLSIVDLLVSIDLLIFLNDDATYCNILSYPATPQWVVVE
jgi:hypothetical protein